MREVASMNRFFPYPLNTTHLADGVSLLLDEDFVFDDPIEGRIRVPKRFVTNLASTPRLLWAFLPPHGRYKFAAVVHDYLYKTQPFGPGFKGWRRSDDLMFRAMSAAPVPPLWITRVAVWTGLALAGWLAYRKSTRQKDLVANYWRT